MEDLISILSDPQEMVKGVLKIEMKGFQTESHSSMRMSDKDKNTGNIKTSILILVATVLFIFNRT